MRDGEGANKASASKGSGGRGDAAQASAIIIRGRVVSHITAIKKIIGELNGIVFGAENFALGTAKGLKELASK